MHEAYARALYTTARGKSPEEQARVFEVLLDLLRKRGHESLIPKIHRTFAMLISTEEEKDEVELTLAKASYFDRFESDIRDTVKKHFGDARIQSVIRIDNSLIGGYVVRKGDREVDASYKTHLLSLFNALRGAQS